MKFDKVTCADGLVIQANEDESLRLRYHTVDSGGDRVGRKKNTLITFAEKDGNAIFFGIARLNLDCLPPDRFNRKRGRAIAASRLKQAIDEFSDPAFGRTKMLIGDSMLYGAFPKNNVESLLTYFKNIDVTVNAARQAEYPPRKPPARILLGEAST